MPDQPDDNSISGVEAPEPRQPSLREIAEAAYDSADEDTSTDDDTSSDRGDGRDSRGRFASKEQAQEAGEAEDDSPPSPEDKTAEAQTKPDPAQGSNQAPEHWSAEDKAVFAKLPEEARNFFMRRYTEMEADYTRKSQANAGAVQTIQALAPIFNDPDIVRSMQEQNLHPVQAIAEWARFHKGATSQDTRVRAAVLVEIAERMGFDPARVFAPSRPPTALTPEMEQDPKVRFFADLQGKTASDLQALRNELQQFKQQETERLEQEAVRVNRSAVDAFADEKGADGKPLRPYFDRVLPAIINAYKIDPNSDLNKVYEQACWADPEVRQHLLQAEVTRKQNVVLNQRAQQAAKSNVRGLTSPVAKPAAERKGNGALRDMLEASADEVGF